VKQGDCIMSVAEAHGFFWETIWNHPDNGELKQLRNDPNILFPGDIVIIPEITLRIENAPTDTRTKFVKKTNHVHVRLRLLDMKRKPRPNAEYIATVDDVVSTGHSDGNGYITIPVRPDSRQLKLKVIDGTRTDEYTLPLGSIDPIDEISGVQQRLSNLGYPCSSEQGTMGEITRSAICAFQKEMNLNVTGELDDSTRQKLEQIHGS
jgi:hypothetical protein